MAEEVAKNYLETLTMQVLETEVAEAPRETHKDYPEAHHARTA
jgi:hypothetical protein